MSKHCFKVPIDLTRPYDTELDKVINKTKSMCADEDDDSLNLAIGETSSGKSNLFLWFYHNYMGDKRSIDFISLTRGGFTGALKRLLDTEQPRCLMYDEANISKREGLSRWNKDMIDTYFSIRGLNICHLWCNPSLDYLDKEFIEERIKRIFLIIKPHTIKDKKKPYRFYYYFKIEDIIAIFEKYGNLKYRTLYKVRKQYATYRGWFKKYDGDLLDQYKSLKQDRMKEKVLKLDEKHGDSNGHSNSIQDNSVLMERIKEMKAQNHTNREIAAELGLSDKTIQRKWVNYKLNLLDKGTPSA